MLATGVVVVGGQDREVGSEYRLWDDERSNNWAWFGLDYFFGVRKYIKFQKKKIFRLWEICTVWGMINGI